MKNHQIKTYILTTLFLFPSFALAESIDVTANPPSGTYHAPIRIELNTTQPGAKTFYSFKPDGYPQDAYLYTGAILLKKSSPLIFFSIISPTNESKIKQNDYIIEYSPKVHFSTEEVTLDPSGIVNTVIVNESDKDINIGFYQVQSESSMTEVPEGTILAPEKLYTVSFKYTGTSSIVLRSPDGEERGILQVVRVEPKPVSRTTSSSSASTSTSYTHSQQREKMPSPESAPFVQDVTSVEQSTDPVTETPVSSESTSPPDTTAVPEPVIAPVPIGTASPENADTSMDIGADIKTSASESGTGIQSIYLFSLLSLAVLLGGIQFWVRKKKS